MLRISQVILGPFAEKGLCRFLYARYRSTNTMAFPYGYRVEPV
jgi:hypothetical protein